MLSFSTLLSRSLRLSPNPVFNSFNSSVRVPSRRSFADQRTSTSAEEQEEQGATSSSTTLKEEQLGSERAEVNAADLSNPLTDLAPPSSSSSSSTPPSSSSSSLDPSSSQPSSQWSTLSSQITQEENRVNAERAERRRREEEMSRVRAEKERVESGRVEKAREAIRLRRLASTTTRTPVSEPTSSSSSSSPPPPPLLSTTPKTTRSSRVSKLSSTLTSTITSERSPSRPTTSSPEGKVKEDNFQRITSDEWALIELVRGAKVKPSMVSMEMFLKRLQSPRLSTTSPTSQQLAPRSQPSPPPRHSYSFDPLLNTPTPAHFADPASRTVFLNVQERRRWLDDILKIRQGTTSLHWEVEDEPIVKMEKGWEVALKKRAEANEEKERSEGERKKFDPSSPPTTPVEPSGPIPLLRLLGLKGRAESS